MLPRGRRKFILVLGRNVTTVADNQPSSFVTYEFSIVPDTFVSSEAARIVLTIASVLSVASPTGVRDTMIVLLIGAGSCPREQARTILDSGDRVLSPAYWLMDSPSYALNDDNLFSRWIGAIVIPVFIFVLQVIVAVSRCICKTQGLEDDDDDADNSLSTGGLPTSFLFPSWTFGVLRIFACPTCYYSIEMLSRSASSPADHVLLTVLGSVGVAIIGTVTLFALYWTIFRRSIGF